MSEYWIINKKQKPVKKAKDFNSALDVAFTMKGATVWKNDIGLDMNEYNKRKARKVKRKK